MAVYAIGDLHGCYRPLQALLETLNFKVSDDRLWFVGDLVNRGPHSLECLRAIKALGDRAITVLGNHDLSLLATASQENALERCNASLLPILKAPDCDELLDWLRNRPLAHHDAELGWLMVHAGLAPEWNVQQTLKLAAEVETVLQSDRHASLLSAMFGDLPAQWQEDLQGNERLRTIINYLTRVRMCAGNGDLLMRHKGPAEFEPDARPWFRLNRASHGTRVVFGHWSALQQLRWPDDAVWCIDSGCAWGGQLSAIRLDHPATPLFQVPSDQPVPKELQA